MTEPPAPGLAAGPADADDDVVFPATFAQTRLFFLQELDPGSATYNIPFGIRLRGALDVGAMQTAVTAVHARHETLRTTLDVEDGAVVQVVHAAAQAHGLQVHDVRATPDPVAASTSTARAEANRPFDLRVGPLARFSLVRERDDQHLLLAVLHHVIADGWSLGVLERELAQGYSAACAGEAPGFAPLAIQYGDFALWERDQVDGPASAALEQFWTTTLAGPLPVLALPSSGERVATGGRRPAARTTFRVAAPLATRVADVARAERCTPFMVYLAAFQLLLARHAGQEDVVVGSPIAGRDQAELQPLIGLFLNTLALRTNLGGEPSWRELVGRVRRVTLDAYEHQALPFERVVALLQPDRIPGVTPVFQAIFSMQNATATAGDLGDGTRARFAGLEASRGGAPLANTKFDLQLTLAPEDGAWRGSVEYDAALFGAAQVERLAGHYLRLLEGCVAAPTASAWDTPMLGDVERARVLHEWNATAHSLTDAPLHEVVRAQAARTPAAVAVEADREDGAADVLTYAELVGRASALARWMRAHGVAPGAAVGVSLERSSDLVVAILGTLAAGAHYVPLDPGYPVARLADMVAQADIAVLLTQRALAGRIAVAQELSLDAEWSSVEAAGRDQADPLPTVSPGDGAYVIFTSGSTGRPKGVLLTHRGATNLMAWMAATYPLDGQGAVLQKASIGFDASVWEVFYALTTGARLVLARPGGQLDPAYLVDLIRRAEVTDTLLVPSQLQVLLDEPAMASCPSLRRIYPGGAAVSANLMQRLADVVPQARVVNLYGPTEITVAATHAPLTGDDSGRSIPIGRPIFNTQAYVVDARLQPQPIGVSGELLIGGLGLAWGYLGDPARTADRFVPDALTGSGRLYRTGDRVRWREDGQLEYLGRLDYQVKIRGFRVEPAEVEQVLLAHPASKDGIVVVRDAGAAGLHLVAYLVPHAQSAAVITPASMRTYLRERLPEHMVPSAFVILDALPIGVNGKVDRARLPLPDQSAVASAADHVPARTTLEHQLLAIWESLLPARPIGIRDDFFAIGGHSLLALRMLAMLTDVSGRRLPLAALFDGATIERIAARVEAAVFDESEPPVVVLQGGAAGRPLAFVHGDVRGGGWYCRRMAPLLSPDMPMYVLPTRGGDGADAPLTIEGMAAQHVREVRRLQPHGPYRVGGFCAGGVIAYEMACQLSEAGETVEQLLVVESAASNAGLGFLRPWVALGDGAGDSLQALATRGRRLRLARQVRSSWNRFTRLSWAERLQWFLRNSGTVLGLRAAPPAAGTPQPPRADEFEARPGTELLRVQGRAASAYVPRRYNGRLDVLTALDASGPSDADLAAALGTEAASVELQGGTRGWHRVAPRARAFGMRASHVGIITDQLPVLADRLRRCLADEAPNP